MVRPLVDYGFGPHQFQCPACALCRAVCCVDAKVVQRETMGDDHVGGFRFTDLGPFRAIRYESLKAICMEDKDYGWTVEMQIKAVRQNLRICEIPVRYRKRLGVSKITGTVSGTIKAGVKIIYTIFLCGDNFYILRNSPSLCASSALILFCAGRRARYVPCRGWAPEREA